MGWPKGKPRTMPTEPEALNEPSANDDSAITFGDLDSDQIAHVVANSVAAASPAGVLSPEMAQLALILQQNMLAAVAEMKKPSIEDQERMDAEKVRKRNNERQTLLRMKAGEDQLLRSQASCEHALPTGKTIFRAQLNSDGCYRPFCVKCKFISRPIRGDQFRLNNSPIDLYKLDASHLTIPRLNAMADASLPPMAVFTLPVGSEVDLVEM